MDNISFRRNFSSNTLFRMVILAIAVAVLIYSQQELIHTVYFENQMTKTGMVINSTILALFAAGLIKMIMIFLSYIREEAAINRFIRNQEKNKGDDPLKGIPARSIIARRYATMVRLNESNTVINQSALASTLIASESTRTSLPKFINNILILAGVFGTIVSLSIALMGASDLLENTVNVGGMGLIVHGMSTALSTTITAIICYVFFGYFFLKLTDAQTNLVSAIEQVSITYLIPKFQVQTDTVLYEFTGLIRSLQGLVTQMVSSQKSQEKIGGQLAETLNSYQGRIEDLKDEMNTVIHILRDGFRLREEESNN